MYIARGGKQELEPAESGQAVGAGLQEKLS
jgi:hypothetical protein